MMLRSLLSIALLAGSAAAQDVTSAADAENMFYRAFYLHRGERRLGAAVELYQKFLQTAPHSRFAPRALRDAVALLQQAGKKDAAAELQAKYGSKDAAASRESGDKKDRAADRPARADAPAGEARKLTDDEKSQMRDRIAGLKERLANAEAAGEADAVERLKRQLERAQRQLESGVMRGREDRRNRGGRRERMAMKFSEMSDAEIKERLQRIESFRGRMIERLRASDGDEVADKMEKQWKEMKKALADGKKEKAQEIFNEMMQSVRRRR